MAAFAAALFTDFLNDFDSTFIFFLRLLCPLRMPLSTDVIMNRVFII
jgi:hypothetical protein